MLAGADAALLVDMARNNTALSTEAIEDRSHTIDGLLAQLRAIWAWMLQALNQEQLTYAVRTLFHINAAWLPPEVILAPDDVDGSDGQVSDV